MADNTTLNTMAGGDTISTDDLTTLNNATISGQKVQRMKTGFGVDGSLTDVTSTTPLPVVDTSDENSGINVASLDGQQIATTAPGVQLNSLGDEFGTPLNTTAGSLNTVIANTPTVQPKYSVDQLVTGQLGYLGSTVSIPLSGYGSIQGSVTGTFSMTYQFEGTLDNVTWFSVRASFYTNGAPPTSSTVSSGSAFSFMITMSGLVGVRLRVSAYTSGFAVVILKTTTASQSDPTAKLYTIPSGDGATYNSDYFPVVASINLVNNGSNNANWDRSKTVVNATNTTGTGIPATGLLAQLDDTAPTAITENQFGNLRMSSRRALLQRGEDQNSPTYSASTTITPAVSATDVFTITGNASTTVVVTKLRISGTQTTGGMATVIAVKRSTADTAGTSTAVTAVAHDSTDSAASATLLNYSANPTTGTLVGNVRADSIPLSAATQQTLNVMEWTFGTNGRGVTLRGTAQVLAVNLNGVTITGGSILIDCEWYEFA